MPPTGEPGTTLTASEGLDGLVTATPARSAKRRTLYVDALISVAIAAAIIGLAQILASAGAVSPLIMPKPTAVAAALRDGFESGVFEAHLISTVVATVVGFLISCFIGIGLAAFLVTWPRAYRTLMPFIVAFQSLPKIAIAPLAIIWLGFGITSKIVLIILVAFFPILINTMQGLRITNREQYELMASLGASRYQVLRYIRIPNALPSMFAGFNVAIIFALLGAIVAEFVGSQEGLGHLLIQQQAVFNVPGVYAVLLILMILGVVFRQIMLAVERKVVFWAKDAVQTSN
jgi:NitT/TauT family transport system permease protein